MKNNTTPDRANDTSDRSILIIENDEFTASTLEYLFSRLGYQVIVERDGRQAQAKIEAGGNPPATVLLELMLPYVDGFELLRRIRASSSWSEVPVVILSAKSHEDDIARAFRLDASDYVLKPFRPTELVARIERFICS